MRALILADKSFAARERDMLTRVQVGLIDEGVRVVEAIPSDVADPDANPLIPTIPYSDRIVLLAARSRVRRIVRGMQSIEPPLAPPDNALALVDVIHVFGEQAWPVSAAVAEVTGASVVVECATEHAVRHARMMEKSAQSGELPVTGAWIAPNARIADALDAMGMAWPVVKAEWGTHASDHAAHHHQTPSVPLSISIIASGDDPTSIAGLLGALATCPHLPADAMIFMDAGAFERHPALWRRARDLRLLERMSLIDRMEARRDLVLQTDVLVIPERLGEVRSIILDAMACEMSILAREDPFVEATSAPNATVRATGGSVDAWADALARLLADASTRPSIGKAAREFVVARRPVHRQIEAILGAYRMVRGETGLKFPG